MATDVIARGMASNSLTEAKAYTDTFNSQVTNITPTNDGTGLVFTVVGGSTFTISISDWNALTNAEKVKLNGIETGAQVNAINSINGKTGAVVLNASDVGALPSTTTIPDSTSDLTNDSGYITNTVNNLTSYYLKTEIDTSLTGKVSVETGKGLSTNDLTDTLKSVYDDTVADKHTHSNKSVLDATTASYLTAEKTKLFGIAEGANNYSLPTATSNVLGGIRVGSNLSIADGVLSAEVDSTTIETAVNNYLTENPPSVSDGSITYAKLASEVKTGRGNVLIVGKGTNFTYNTLKSAESAASSGDTILVYPGTYEDEYYIGTSKCLHWIGLDKNAVIVTNDDSEKSHSVFNLYGGSSLENMTIIETHENPTSLVESVAYKAYCVHADSSNMEGTTTVIRNCVLRNKYFACLGIGLYQDAKVIVENCDCTVYDTNPTENYQNYGAIYCHGNSESGVTGQQVSIKNCLCNTVVGFALRIDNSSIGTMTSELINNTAVSGALGITNQVKWITNTTNPTVTMSSHGNNAANINYSNVSDGNEVYY
jgi:hypothetical protein